VVLVRKEGGREGGREGRRMLIGNRRRKGKTNRWREVADCIGGEKRGTIPSSLCCVYVLFVSGFLCVRV